MFDFIHESVDNCFSY